MKFQLYINAVNHHVKIITEGQQSGADFVLLAERDPEEEIQFTSDCAYYNPLLKRIDALQLFLVNGTGDLMGYHSGRPPGSLNKAERKILWRGWFKLIPRNLSALDVPPLIFAQMQRFPKMKGVISQAIRTQMGLRVPDELEAPDIDAWMAWIMAQRMAITPVIKSCFEQLRTSPSFLVFPVPVKTFFLTGVEPEPQFEIRVRRCEIRTVKQLQRQLFESYEHRLTVPKSLLDAGNDALLAHAKKEWGDDWDQIQQYSTGSDLIQADKAESIETGLIIFVKGPNDSSFQFWSDPAGRPDSIHDLFAKVIEEQEHNARVR